MNPFFVSTRRLFRPCVNLWIPWRHFGYDSRATIFFKWSYTTSPPQFPQTHSSISMIHTSTESSSPSSHWTCRRQRLVLLGSKRVRVSYIAFDSLLMHFRSTWNLRICWKLEIGIHRYCNNQNVTDRVIVICRSVSYISWLQMAWTHLLQLLWSLRYHNTREGNVWYGPLTSKLGSATARIMPYNATCVIRTPRSGLVRSSTGLSSTGVSSTS